MTLPLGATAHPGDVLAFRVWAPHAARVSVRLLGDHRVVPLEPRTGGFFETVVMKVRGHAEYLYVLDGALERPDPVSRLQTSGPTGPSRTPGGGQERWVAPPRPEPRLPVANPWSVPRGRHGWTFTAMARTVSSLAAQGARAVEIGPVTERDVTGLPAALMAPDRAAGGPRGLAELVAACHGAGLAIAIRLPFGCLGPAASYLGDFGPWLVPAQGTGAYRLDLRRAAVRSLAARVAVATLLEWGADAATLVEPEEGWEGLASLEAEMAELAPSFGLPEAALLVHHPTGGPCPEADPDLGRGGVGLI